MIQSIVKASNILEYMKTVRKECTIAELSESMGLPPSTTHRILNTLIACSLVSKDERTHLYKLGSGLISLGMMAITNINLQEEAMTVLKELSKITKEDSFLVIKSSNNGVVVGKSEGAHTLKIVEHFGREIPLHKGAIRKILLANQDSEFIDQYLSQEIEPYITGKVSKLSLEEELKKIKKENIAISHCEYIKDATGIGSGVFNYKNEIVASLGIVLPLERSNENLEFYVENVKKSALKLSEKLGYFNE